MTNFERQDIPVRTLVSGHELTLPVFRYRGSAQGPKVYVQANLHGAEVQGNAVIFELMNYLKENHPLSDITLVPQCNPFGANQKSGEYTQGRFDPTTGANWNRNFFYITAQKEGAEFLNVDDFAKKHFDRPWEEVKVSFKKELAKKIALKKELAGAWGLSHGEALCLTLQELSCDADVVLDLHTASVATDYLYSPQYAKNEAMKLNIAHVLLIPEAFDGAMDEANFCPWWDLKQAFVRLGREVAMDFFAFTVELSSQETLSFSHARQFVQKFIDYFKEKNILPKSAATVEKNERQKIWGSELKHFKNLYSPQGGLVEYAVTPGQQVQKGELLAKILNFKLVEGAGLEPHTTLVLAPQSGVVINRFPSASILQGQSLFLLLTELQELA